MAKVQVFENKKPTLGINGLGQNWKADAVESPVRENIFRRSLSI